MAFHHHRGFGPEHCYAGPKDESALHRGEEAEEAEEPRYHHREEEAAAEEAMHPHHQKDDDAAECNVLLPHDEDGSDDEDDSDGEDGSDDERGPCERPHDERQDEGLLVWAQLLHDAPG